MPIYISNTHKQGHTVSKIWSIQLRYFTGFCLVLLSEAKELTQRESEILRYVGRGHCNKSVAKTLAISERIVRFQLSNYCIKLNENGRTNAVAIAISQSLFEI